MQADSLLAELPGKPEIKEGLLRLIHRGIITILSFKMMSFFSICWKQMLNSSKLYTEKWLLPKHRKIFFWLLSFHGFFTPLNSFFIPCSSHMQWLILKKWHGQANTYSYFCNLNKFAVTITNLKTLLQKHKISCYLFFIKKINIRSTLGFPGGASGKKLAW